MNVTEAHQALKHAEAKLSAAKTALREAHDRLDVAFAANGWRRLVGAFEEHQRFYVNVLYPAATLDRRAVLEVLDREQAAA
jgi:hypothetical protein